MSQKFKRVKILINLILVSVLLLMNLSTSLAWLANDRIVGEFSATTMLGFFARGNGTEEDPYVINRPTHLYNLAWLQNSGIFNNTEGKEYFRISDATDNNGAITLDMGGKLTGTNGTETGAIPPIGTEEYPFNGVIDGSGSVIKNLWVSTKPSDWKEQPENIEQSFSGSYVGLFGKISDGAVVENFVLDRVEVTNDVEDACMGLICGFVDAKLQNVSVFNGIVTPNSAKCHSRFTLVGDISQEVYWEGMPEIDGGESGGVWNPTGGGGGGQGGGLTIDPEQIHNNGDLASNTPLQVDDAIPGTAYYVGPVSYMTSTATTLYDFSESENMTNIVGNTTYLSNLEQNDPKKYKRVTETIANLSKGTLYVNIPNSTPFTAQSSVAALAGKKTTNIVTANIVGDNNENLGTVKVPGPGVWFKPKVSDTLALAFYASNSSSNRYMMIYKLQRDLDANGNTVSFTIIDAREFHLPGQNGASAYYEYQVYTDNWAEQGLEENAPNKPDKVEYEYMLSVSSISGHYATNKGQIKQQCFTYIHLAGTSVNEGSLPGGHGGGTGGTSDPDKIKYIKGMRFITKDELSDIESGDLSIEEDINSNDINSILGFELDNNGTDYPSSLYFTAKIKDPNTDDYVYYYSTSGALDDDPPTDSVTVHESASGAQSDVGVVGDYYVRKKTTNENDYVVLQ